MRFILSLNTTQASQSELPLNYQYPLSAAVYKIIERANDGYAEFLHTTGYKYHNKRFKFFTFSDIRTWFRIKGDRMIMNSNTAELTICFHIPDASENFIRGLFMKSINKCIWVNMKYFKERCGLTDLGRKKPHGVYAGLKNNLRLIALL